MEKIFELLLTSPEMANALIKEMVSKYKPTIYAVLTEGFDMYKDFVANDEYFEQRALGKKKALDALMAQGFTREESLLFMLDAETAKTKALNSISKTNATTKTSKK